MGKLNWKKVLLFGTVSTLLPSIQQWANSVQAGEAIPFTAATILVPAIPTAIAVFSALFTNPRYR